MPITWKSSYPPTVPWEALDSDLLCLYKLLLHSSIHPAPVCEPAEVVARSVIHSCIALLLQITVKSRERAIQAPGALFSRVRVKRQSSAIRKHEFSKGNEHRGKHAYQQQFLHSSCDGTISTSIRFLHKNVRNAILDETPGPPSPVLWHRAKQRGRIFRAYSNCSVTCSSSLTSARIEKDHSPISCLTPTDGPILFWTWLDCKPLQHQLVARSSTS